LLEKNKKIKKNDLYILYINVCYRSGTKSDSLSTYFLVYPLDLDFDGDEIPTHVPYSNNNDQTSDITNLGSQDQ
jgi:hypothetical protein